MTTTQNTKKRNIIGFEPSGPIAAMVTNELRSGKTKTNLMEDCIAAALGKKYPKLLERFKVLREESAT